MSEHTPGPWETDLMADREGDWFEIVAPIMSRTGTVADTLNRDTTIDPEADRANAKLIAAAPDLLHALRLLHDETADYVHLNNLGDPHHNRSMQLARSAIAKATGT